MTPAAALPDAGDGGDVARGDRRDGDAVPADHHGHLLDPLGLGAAERPHALALLDLARVDPPDGDLAGVWVHPDLGDHQGERAVLVALYHGLALHGLEVALPDVGDPVDLGLDRRWELVDGHVEEDLVDRGLLGELLLLVVPAVLEDLREVDALLRHERHGHAPVVVGGAEGDGALLDGDPPLLLERVGGEGGDQVVDLGDDGLEALHHLRAVDLELVDEPVDLVDEQDRSHLLLQGLPDDGLGLGHGALDGARQDDAPVHGPHGSGDVPAEVDVAGRVDEVDEVVVPGDVVDHRGRCSVDRDATGGLLLVEVQYPGLASEVLGHHARPGDQVVGERGLPVVDVGCDREVAYPLPVVHYFCCSLDVVFLTSHLADHRRSGPPESGS